MQSDTTNILMKDMAINSNGNGMRSSLFVTEGRAVPQLRKLYAKLVVFNENIVVAKKIYLHEGRLSEIVSFK